MKNFKMPSDFLLSFFQAAFVTVYCVAIVFFINLLSPNVTSAANSFLGAFLFLMLFVVSALITGGVVLGYPAYLALNKNFERAVKLLVAVTLWMILLGAILFISLFIATAKC